MGDPLALFHPAVRGWFERRFPSGPTEPQLRGWPAIARREHTLVAAPTGSGKTLAAFLVQIDALLRRSEAGELADGIHVVYVSPLKALAADIHHNLELPLAEIRALAAEGGRELPPIRAAVRSGDTTSTARAAMLRQPPHLLVTTPESLYLLLTAERSRELLRSVDTVIVDEIHALARDKRGSHLALSLERLTALCDAPPQRIGLSATQRPVATLARLLVGGSAPSSHTEPSSCRIVDLGHQRALDLALEIPDGELEAVATTEQFGWMLDRIAALVAEHRTTLVFVNTRRLAERVAHLLAERLGEGSVGAHHGSLSKERRTRLEARLRAGDLRALVATASLELGIDIGPVDLVCQIGSPRSFATFLQRVGRSGHAHARTAKGRLFPLSRDELVECAALLRGVQAGRLDRVHPPERSLDVLAQQIVAACAAEPWSEDELFALVRRAAPFAELLREDFDAVVAMLGEGVRTGRGRVGAWLHRDQVNGLLRGRRGARLVALTSGGAIPENADYRVVAEPDDTFVGTVNEDFAIESMVGDVFLLGSTSWRIRRVSNGVVRVRDAEGVPPTIPFWLGEAPARTTELSEEVSSLRAAVAERLAEGGLELATAWLEGEGLPREVADALARYLDAARTALGVVPTCEDVVFERFFDETGGMQLVVHAPFGGRINRGLGLALRKRFCRSFDFELQAAANDDAVLLSLGPQHGFELKDVARFLSPETIEEVLAQALLASPMFTVRWRWNLGRALLVPRQRGGRRVPPPLQRMQADDLMAALFPSLAACQENVTGPVEIPDHPIVQQTIRDCLSEATDVAGLRTLLSSLRSGGVRAHYRDTTEPSPLTHEILNGKPYTFLDDAPLEERRSRAVALRRGLPESARDLGRLDAAAIDRVRGEAAPEPRDVDELHDLLLSLVVARPSSAWEPLFDELVRSGRAARVEAPSGWLWLATERRPAVEALLGTRAVVPDVPVPASVARDVDVEHVATDALRGQLECSGPVTLAELVARTGLASELVEIGAARLEAEGFALRGHFDPRRERSAPELCSRRLLARIHLYTQERLRREIEPVSPQELMRFLLRWQFVAPGRQREGRRGLLAVIEQLQGFELAAGAWEESVLRARVSGYRAEWLDELCLGGQVAWARTALPGATAEEASPSRVSASPSRVSASPSRVSASPSRATPLGFALRDDLPWLLAAARDGARPAEPLDGVAARILTELRDAGALFAAELAGRAGCGAPEVDAALFDLVARGLVVADGFGALRSLLDRRRSGGRSSSPRRGRVRRGAGSGGSLSGRFALLPEPADGLDREALCEAVAEQLLVRWGVVFRDLLVRESLAVPWREVLRALRRMEARGTARGGRFVTGFAGEQFALPGAVEALRSTRRQPRTGERVTLSAADPLNLVGIVTPGARVPALRGHVVCYVDGALEEPGVATAS